jgi:hypothetical protein
MEEGLPGILFCLTVLIIPEANYSGMINYLLAERRGSVSPERKKNIGEEKELLCVLLFCSVCALMEDCLLLYAILFFCILITTLLFYILPVQEILWKTCVIVLQYCVGKKLEEVWRV